MTKRERFFRAMRSQAARIAGRCTPKSFLGIVPKLVAVHLVSRFAMNRHLVELVRSGHVESAIDYIRLSLKKKETRARRRGNLSKEPAKADGKAKTIIILGPVRTGKTAVARRLAHRLGYYLLSLDRFNKILNAVPPGPAKDEFHRRLLETAISFSRYPKIIEGIAAFTIASANRIGERRLVSLEPALSVSCKTGAMLTVIGSATSSPQAKLVALKKHRDRQGCWTRKLSEAELAQQAQQIIQMSCDLRTRAAELGLAYYDIRVEHYFQDIDRTVDALATAVDRVCHPIASLALQRSAA